MPGASAHPLEYARPSRRRWLGRRGVLLLLMAALIFIGWRYRKPVESRLGLMYWQGKCLTYARPPGSVVFEAYLDTAKLVPALAIDPDIRVRRDPVTGALDGQWRDPACLRQFEILLPPGVLPSGGSGTAFLHQRTSKSGNVRLVHISMDWVGPIDPASTFNWAVIKPATLFAAAQCMKSQDCNVFVGPCGADGLGFGQADPIDESHFTIVFGGAHGKRTGVIDCWLQDDDTLVFKTQWAVGSWQASIPTEMEGR